MSITKTINRKILLPIIKSSRISELIAKYSSNNNLILNYHGVVKNFKPNLSRNHLPVSQFEEQMVYFKKRYNVVSVAEIFESKTTKKRDQKRKNIAITFDDGYRNNFETAYPILNSLNLPATIFVTGQSIQKPESPLWYDLLDILSSLLQWEVLRKELKETGIEEIDPSAFSNYHQFKNFIKAGPPSTKHKILAVLNRNKKIKDTFENCNQEYWKLMSPADLISISKNSLIEIGSHGLTHSNLDVQNEVDLHKEITESKKLLEECINKNVDSIAFPDGAYNQNVKDQCKRVGYKRMLAVNYRTQTDTNDPEILPRLSISNTTTSDSIIINTNLSFSKVGF